ncbi:MAG: modification methylase, partial [Lentisphaeria bacterium]|nr:modification methylase [Lentisphaeria bacterium]
KGVRWFTNLDYLQRHEDLILYKRYTPEEFPKYDNYDAINVAKTADIPYDYEGVMGVPITFIDKFNPDQFEILGATESEGKGFSCGLWDETSGVAQPMIKGEKLFKRIFIRRKGVVSNEN